MQTLDEQTEAHPEEVNLESIGNMGWLRAVGIFLGFILLWRASGILEYAPHASIWFPPAGWSLAAFLVFGVRALFPIAAAILITTMWSNAMYGVQMGLLELLIYWLIFVFCHCLPYGLGAALLRQFVRFGVVRQLPAMIMAFLALGVLTSLLASFLGTQVVLLSSAVNIMDVYTIWLARWIGDMTGVMVLTPIFMALMLWKQPVIGSLLRTLRLGAEPSPLYHFGLKVTILISCAYFCILANWWFEHRDVAFAVFFLIIPQMWIAYTENPLRAAASLGLFSFSLAIGISVFDLGESAIIYQFAITVIASSVYFGVAVPVLLAQNQQLQYQAQTDYLTGLSNRRHFMESAEEETLRARQYGYPLTLAMMNIEHFTRINDTYGYEIGDRVLLAVSQSVAEQLRPADLFARFGGDEFFVLMAGVSRLSAHRILDRARESMRYIVVEGVDEPIAARFVIVQLEPEQSIDEAIQIASREMLNAPRSGLNGKD
ncbi:sensor domain-containing diguanylate cyclase [Aliidiomarina sanyensis]|uniref:diguanylate cyclase n=1 Tax=Aliidiomarina sanyensis TaxID=1249555 RepID=A0A432WBW3_9GAMM|nr:diguanylate cyclase [Aliidiomarina sanyensis]RUO29459.1 sensor domain-containing diguanylate cyclase [Aliidiomarina sanyensis]